VRRSPIRTRGRDIVAIILAADLRLVAEMGHFLPGASIAVLIEEVGGRCVNADDTA
jgi:hypothetical protein